MLFSRTTGQLNFADGAHTMLSARFLCVLLTPGEHLFMGAFTRRDESHSYTASLSDGAGHMLSGGRPRMAPAWILSLRAQSGTIAQRGTRQEPARNPATCRLSLGSGAAASNPALATA